MADSDDEIEIELDDDAAHTDDQAEELANLAEISREEKEWKTLSLEKQCDDVLDLLSQGNRRWERGVGDPDIPALEEYKKRTLAFAQGKGDIMDNTRMTALHWLAKSDKTSTFAKAPPHVCRQLIGYLLENESRIHDTDADKLQEGREERLVLEYALFSDNNKFLDCVDECLGDRFPDFLHRQDENKKNCLHHLFSWSRRNRRATKSPDQNKKYVTQLKKLALRAHPATLTTADNEGNTPIHYALHLEECYDRDNEYLKIVKVLILRADETMVKTNTLYNHKRESPVMYYRRIYAEVKEKNVKKAKKKAEEEATKEQGLTMPGQKQAQAQAHGPDSWAVEGSSRKAAPQKGGSYQKTDDPKAGLVAPGEHPLFRVPAMDGSRDPQSLVQPRMLPPGRKREPPTASAPAKTSSKTGDTRLAKSKENTATPAMASTKADTCNSLGDFLKEHYTVTRSDLNARDHIFGRGAHGWATNLYFDARGLQDTDKILEVLDRMQAGGFGAILSYVNIPAIRQSPAHQQATDTVDTMDRGHLAAKNPRDLTGVFNKLYSKPLSVRRIWRLEVEDRQCPSHSDAAIERSIQGREDAGGNKDARGAISVHIWDWRKPDLNTDVIAFAATDVKVVHLSWSGNQTVLKAWGCHEGIPRLHSITGVEKILIHASPGIEALDRMKMAIERFKESLKLIFPKVAFPARPTPGRETKDKLKERLRRLEKALCTDEMYPDSVEIEFPNSTGGLFANTDANEETIEYIGDDPTEKQHVWVDAMDSFRSALIALKPCPKDRVRVALIDDGVNLGSVNIYGGIVNVNGLSFHTSDRQTENPWHCSTGGHGTVMANMILRLNPWADLFVIRLQSGVNHNQGRTISQLSAAQAIEAAIDLRVQIISVSWTIKYRGGTVTGLTPNEAGGASSTTGKDPFSRLTDAIDKVKKEGILMFCSASDDIQTTAMKVLPYSQQPEHIFRIGAALWLGQRDPVTENQDRIDWFFPGNQVAEAKNPRAQGPIKYHDGSSVGTALAAGLASLVMFLARLVRTRYESEAEKTKELQAKHENDKSERQKLEEEVRKKTDLAQAFGKRAKDLEDRNKMKHALDMIGRKGNFQPDKKYLPVWDTFNHVTEVLTTATKDHEKWDELAKLVETLCQGPI